MRSPVSIRSIDPADLATFHGIIECAYRGDAARLGWTHEADMLTGPRTSLAELEAILRDPAQRLLGAWTAAIPTGCVAVADRGGGLAYLGQLCVDPQRQAGGVGRQLIAAAEDTARQAFAASRIEMTVIESRVELIDYYVRRGYVATGERRDFPVPVDPPLFMTVLAKPLPVLADA